MPIIRLAIVFGCISLLLPDGIGPAVYQSGGHRFEMLTEDGVSTAVTTGGPRYEGELFTYELILTLEQDPSQLESLIATAQGFTMTSDGLYVVVDNKQARGGSSVARLVVFGPDGRYLRSMGQVGEGPGDFQNMVLQAVRGDTIEVYDPRFRRLTRYRTDGELCDIITAPPGFTQLFRQLFRTTAGDFVAINIQDTNIAIAFVEFWVVTPGGMVSAHHRSPEVRNSIPLDMGGGQAMPYQYPYPPIPAARFVPGRGIAVSAGVEPVIALYGLDGELDSRIRVEDLPLEITGEDIARFDAFWEDRLGSIPESARPDLRRQRDSLREAMPARKPPWTYFLVDDRGYWWLRVQNDPDVWMTGDREFTYRLLSPGGEYLGITRTPPTFIRNSWMYGAFPVSVSNGHVLTIETDPETGGQLLNVYRLVPAARGFSYH